MRAVYPFTNNPLSYQMISDPSRHFSNALDPNAHNIMSIIDPAAYQTWLLIIMNASGKNELLTAGAAALLSMLTPFFYYRWMRLCLPLEKHALIGFVIISWLPGWICYSSYFMQETLLLPLIGLSLWMTWRCTHTYTIWRLLLAALVWGITVNTKASALPLFFIVWIWLCWKLIKKAAPPRAKTIASLTFATACVLALAMLTPLKIYQRLGVFMPAAQQTLNRIYFESGKQKVVINFIFTDRGAEFNQQIRCESPSIYDPPFRPFNYWKMTRAGEGSYTIDLRNGSEVVSPAVSASPGDRLNYSMENAIYFFLGDTWPTDDEYPQTLLDSLTAVSRWLWAPIAVYLVVTMLFNRGAGSATIICLAYLLLFLCQQTIVMEGRYRMPWEGIAIAATIEATANLRRRRAIT